MQHKFQCPTKTCVHTTQKKPGAGLKRGLGSLGSQTWRPLHFNKPNKMRSIRCICNCLYSQFVLSQLVCYSSGMRMRGLVMWWMNEEGEGKRGTPWLLTGLTHCHSLTAVTKSTCDKKLLKVLLHNWSTFGNMSNKWSEISFSSFRWRNEMINFLSFMFYPIMRSNL